VAEVINDPWGLDTTICGILTTGYKLLCIGGWLKELEVLKDKRVALV
jgi:hypothetical protein